MAKYFAILPAVFLGLYASSPGLAGPLAGLNIMGLSSPQSAILSVVIFNALIIIALIPLALRGVHYLGDKVFTYDANHFLVLSVPLPFECETLASPDGPMLGLSIGVTSEMVAELIMGMEMPLPIPQGKPEAVRANPLDAALYDAAVRLLEALEASDDARILGPQIIREIVYRVLRSENGAHLRALAAPHSHFGRISQAMQRMHHHFAQAVDMTTLAAEAGMSVSTFHAHFKAVARSSPLQYLKSVRLHKARMLMVRDGETAAGAALQVGYESASQFSREFKRLFGLPPAAEVEKLKASLIQME